MEPIRDCMNSEICIPGWGARVVSRADQAFFTVKNVRHKVLAARLDTDIDSDDDDVSNKDCRTELIAFNSTNANADSLENYYQDKPHIVFEMEIQCLKQADDLTLKLHNDMHENRKSVEKTTRTWIANTIKAKVKAARPVKKKKQAGQQQDGAAAESTAAMANANKQAKFVFDSLGIEMPEAKDEQIEVLKDLLDEEERYNKLIAKACEAVQPPKCVPLTKLQEGGSRSNRAQLMQAALNAAMAASTSPCSSAAGSATATPDGNGNSVTTSYGLQAALRYAADHHGLVLKDLTWPVAGVGESESLRSKSKVTQGPRFKIKVYHIASAQVPQLVSIQFSVMT